MNQFEARKAICQRWMAMWPGLSTNVPFTIDTDPVTPPAAYAKLSIDFGDAEQQTMGAEGTRRFTKPGSIIVELFGPPGQGAKYLDQLVQHVVTMFESKRFGAVGAEEGLTFFASTHGKLRSVGQYATISVGADFEYTEVR